MGGSAKEKELKAQTKAMNRKLRIDKFIVPSGISNTLFSLSHSDHSGEDNMLDNNPNTREEICLLERYKIE